MKSLLGYQRVLNSQYVGASLIELVVIILVFAVIIGYLVPKMSNQVEEAKGISLIYAGEAFKKSVQMARYQWLATAQGQEVDAIKGFGSTMIATTNKGWPSDAVLGSKASHEDVIKGQKERCSRIWNSLIQLHGYKFDSNKAHSNKVNSANFEQVQSFESQSISKVEQPMNLFRVSTPFATVCRFRLDNSSNLGYIDYNLKSGQVSIVFEGNNDK